MSALLQGQPQPPSYPQDEDERAWHGLALHGEWLRDDHPVCEFQIVSVERIDMHHPSERERQEMTTRALARRRIVDGTLEAEAAAVSDQGEQKAVGTRR